MPSRHAARWTLAAFGILLAALSYFARADENSDFEQRRDEERKNNEAVLSHIPPLDDRSIGGVLRIAVENKALVLRTPLANTEHEGFARVKVTDLGLTGVVRVTGMAPAAAAPIPAVFQFQFTDYRKPLQIDTLAVTVQTAVVEINKNSQFPDDRFANVCLTLRAIPVPAHGGLVHLTVNEGGPHGDAPINLSIEAVDFFTFVRQHPRETDRYLRPMFRDLRQETAFAPDPLIAWQVFPEMRAPDPAIIRQVKEMLPALDQDDFRARGRALLDLEKLGRAGAAALMQLDRTGLTPEQNARIDVALGPYPQLSSRYALSLRSEPVFLLDCMYSEDAALRKIALGQLRAVSKGTIELDVGASLEVRAAGVETMRKRLLDGAK